MSLTGTDIRALLHELNARAGASDARIGFHVDAHGNLIASLTASVRGCRLRAEACAGNDQPIEVPLDICAEQITSFSRGSRS